MFTERQLLAEMPKLNKFSHKLTRNAAEAEDLLQSTLLRAIEKKTYYTENTNLFSWTSKIMYNLFVTEYRRKIKWETQYDPENAISSQSVSAEQENKYEVSKLADAMEKISADHKEILILVCVKGLQYEETSKILNIPVGTVRSRLSRARSELAALMADPAGMDIVSAGVLAQAA